MERRSNAASRRKSYFGIMVCAVLAVTVSFSPRRLTQRLPVDKIKHRLCVTRPFCNCLVFPPGLTVLYAARPHDCGRHPRQCQVEMSPSWERSHAFANRKRPFDELLFGDPARQRELTSGPSTGGRMELSDAGHSLALGGASIPNCDRILT